MTAEDVSAIALMAGLITILEDPDNVRDVGSWAGRQVLYHAIRHLAYPDRDIYPKTRRGTKGAPIVRRQPTVDDLR